MNTQDFSPDFSIFLANLTTDPGVYQLLDADKNVLYVGKAANLKKRINSYFSKSNLSAKTRALIRQVVAVEVHVTRSETEALLLESSLIKSLHPKYNVLLRDDKSYPYIHVNSQHPFPCMKIMRSKKRPRKGSFFGPYPSVTAVRETLSIIQKVFKIRNCRDSYFSGRRRPCLQYQIKRCSAPCTGYISAREYQQSLSDATRFLQGKSQDILDEMESRMEAAVSSLDFEEAARIRDQIKSLRVVQEQQGMVKLRGDADVIVAEVRPGFACIQWVTIRNGQLLASQSFFPSMPEPGLADYDDHEFFWQQAFNAFIAYFYVDTPERIPSLILTNHVVEDGQALQAMLSHLRGKICRIQVKPRGIKARWIDFGLDNLKRAISEYDTSATLMKHRVEALRVVLNLTQEKLRLECFDVSHTQGKETVASCVVFDEHGPCKNEYRRFNITGITPGDDYAALRQAMMRRFKASVKGARLPDVLIIDGGKGQVAVAEEVLNALCINDIKLLGMAKGPSRKVGWEQLILADEAGEMTLPPDSPALHLLQYIRDEAHRFAITLHRKKRQKSGFDSSLETLEGIGAKRRQALLRRFGGLRELAQAPIDEIAKVRGISKNMAARIHQHFHS